MSEALRSVFNVIERSSSYTSYMTTSSEDRYINIPSNDSNEHKNCFEGYKVSK